VEESTYLSVGITSLDMKDKIWKAACRKWMESFYSYIPCEGY